MQNIDFIIELVKNKLSSVEILLSRNEKKENFHMCKYEILHLIKFYFILSNKEIDFILVKKVRIYDDMTVIK